MARDFKGKAYFFYKFVQLFILPIWICRNKGFLVQIITCICIRTSYFLKNGSCRIFFMKSTVVFNYLTQIRMWWNFRWPCFSGSTVYWNFTMHDENIAVPFFCGRPKLKYFLDKMLLTFSVIVAGSGSKLDLHIGPYLSELLLFQGQGHKIRTKWYSFFEAKKVRPFFEWDIKQTMGNRWTMVLEYCF